MSNKPKKPEETNKPFRISGRIIDPTTRKGIEGLRIEPWSKGGNSSNSISSAVADANGAFKMEFEESHLRELFKDEQPDLFFKVFRGEDLLKSTEDKKLWYALQNTGFGSTRGIVIEVPGKEEPPPVPEVHRVAGQLLNEKTGVSLAVFTIDRFHNYPDVAQIKSKVT